MSTKHWWTTLAGAVAAAPSIWIAWRPEMLTPFRWLFAAQAVGIIALGIVCRDRNK